MHSRIGLLWYDAKEFNVDKAIAAYQRRFNDNPNVVYSKEVFMCKGLISKSLSNLSKGYYFLVKGDDDDQEKET